MQLQTSRWLTREKHFHTIRRVCSLIIHKHCYVHVTFKQIKYSNAPMAHEATQTVRARGEVCSLIFFFSWKRMESRRSILLAHNYLPAHGIWFAKLNNLLLNLLYFLLYLNPE